jgi:hypothetical protein
MPWPEPVGVLLTMPGSRAGQALRWGLRGLHASLQAALQETDGDPGCTPLRQLLDELAPLVEGPGSLLPAPGMAAVLPMPADEPPSPGPTGEAPTAGLRPAPEGTLDGRLGPAGEGDMRVLAGIVTAALWLIEHDIHLGHCLKSVFRFGVTPLRGDQRERYVAELLRLWDRLRSATDPAGEGVKEHMKAILDLDEALHSLVYQPPATADPEWGRLLDQARELLFRARDQAVQAGYPVHLQLLGGSFADVNRLAPDSLQVDFGVPGEVAVCLRVWARIDGEELKGRVLYRSPQEEA